LRASGRCDDERRLILLNRNIRDAGEISRVLLHEMCHIGIPDHGRRFMRRLRHLAECGEQWAPDECKGYTPISEDNPYGCHTYNQQVANLRGTLDEIAMWMVQDEKKCSFRQILGFIGLDLGLSDEELLRRMPWIPRAWKNAHRNAQEFR